MRKGKAIGHGDQTSFTSSQQVTGQRTTDKGLVHALTQTEGQPVNEPEADLLGRHTKIISQLRPRPRDRQIENEAQTSETSATRL